MIFTCGLWAFIWGILILGDNPQFNCSQCGATPQFQRAVKKPSAIARWFYSLLYDLNKTFRASAIGVWFFGLNKFFQIILGVLSVFVCFLMLSLFLAITGLNGAANRQTSKSQMNANSNSSQTPIASTSSTPPPSNLSSTENLALGKKALNDGNLTAARSHLSAIAKETKEFSSAKQYLAIVEKREKRNVVENDLNSVKSEQAGVEEMLDATEDFGEQAGSPKKAIYLNALKRKGQLQLRRIELERKLKSMP